MIKVCRASGFPVQHENIQKYKDEMQVIYDKIMVRFGFNPDKPAPIPEDISKRMNYILNRLEQRTQKKYPLVEEWPILQTEEDILAKVEKHGPIMLAKDGATGKLAYVIFDVDF